MLLNIIFLKPTSWSGGNDVTKGRYFRTPKQTSAFFENKNNKTLTSISICEKPVKLKKKTG